MKKILLLPIFLFINNTTLAMLPPKVEQKTIPNHSFECYVEIAKIALSLAHIPGIISSDSTNINMFRLGTGLALASSATKTTYDLFRQRQNSILIKEMIYDLPKVTAYAWCIAYDYYKITHAKDLVEKNKTESRKDLRLKIGQCILLAVEIFLRILASIEYKQNNTTTAIFSSEAADLVELSRMLTRPVLGSKLEKLIEKKQKLLRSELGLLAKRTDAQK
jgi:hypothetical protein